MSCRRSAIYHNSERRLAPIIVLCAAVSLANAPVQGAQSVALGAGAIELARGAYFDVDAGRKGKRAHADIRYTHGPDEAPRRLEPMNGAGLGGIEGGAGLYERCAARVDELTAAPIDLDAIALESVICIRTSEGRPGLLSWHGAKDGARDIVTFTYAVKLAPELQP